MEMEVLKKKISTYRGTGGRVRIENEELLLEILQAWEEWTGPTQGFYRALGVSQKGFASIIGKAKKLKRVGFPSEGFREIKIAEATESEKIGPCQGIELTWDEGRIIRFQQVEQLVEFLKKVA